MGIVHWLINTFIISFIIASIESKSINQNTQLASDSPIETDNLQNNKHFEFSTENGISKFFIIGDFGDLKTKENINYMTNIMNYLAKKDTHDFIITTGDNFYPSGIKNINDLKKTNKVMDYFQKSSIKNLKMFPILGNKDCESNYSNEIAFSDFNSQWEMKSDYFEMKFPLKDDPSKSMVLLMTNP